MDCDPVEDRGWVCVCVGGERELVAGGRLAAVDLECELPDADDMAAVLFIADAEVDAELAVFGIEVERLTRCRLAPALEVGEAERARLRQSQLQLAPRQEPVDVEVRAGDGAGQKRVFGIAAPDAGWGSSCDMRRRRSSCRAVSGSVVAALTERVLRRACS
jgi:hypothetical protein